MTPRRLRLPRPHLAPEQWIGVAVLLIAATIGIVYAVVRAGQQDNRDLINQLACQIAEMGGTPVGGVTCKPRPSPSPQAPGRAVRPAPGGGPSVVMSPVPQRTVIRERHTRVIREKTAPRRHERRSPQAVSPTARPSSSPSPTPLICSVPAICRL